MVGNQLRLGNGIKHEVQDGGTSAAWQRDIGKDSQDSESCEPKGRMMAADRGYTALAVCLIRWRRAMPTVGSRGSEGKKGWRAERWALLLQVQAFQPSG